MEILVYSSEGFKKYEMDQRLPEDTGIELFLYCYDYSINPT